MGLRQKIVDSDFYRQMVQPRATGPLSSYSDITAADPDTPIRNVEFVALDLETTGLDPKHDEIVSIGLVIIRQLAVDFSSCQHLLVRPKKELSESSVIVHRIFDSDVEQADLDASEADRIFSILMGENVELRRDFIERNAVNVKNLDV